MLGHFGVGKTSLVRRFVHGIFSEDYISTVGALVVQKKLESLPTNAQGADQLTFILWDLANVEKMSPLVINHFTRSDGAIIVTDLCRPKSFDEDLIQIKKFIELNPAAKLIFAGNKVDLVQPPQRDLQPLQTIAQNYKAPFLLTSAKSGDNVQTLFETLAESILNA